MAYLIIVHNAHTDGFVDFILFYTGQSHSKDRWEFFEWCMHNTDADGYLLDYYSMSLLLEN
jgi:hypothetical protein